MSQQDYFKNRRICVKRDTTTMPGYVITHWHRNGKPDTKGPAVITNRLQKIVGSEQKNHIQDLAERMKQSAEAWRTSATNNAARVERVTAALDERRAEYVQERDAAALPSTKEIYQAIIYDIDFLNGEMNEYLKIFTKYTRFPNMCKCCIATNGESDACREVA